MLYRGAREARRTLSVSQIEISGEFRISAQVPLLIIVGVILLQTPNLPPEISSSSPGMEVTSLRFQAASTFALAKRRSVIDLRKYRKLEILPQHGKPQPPHCLNNSLSICIDNYFESPKNIIFR